ncbi:MAG: FkbM family methyltransferase [Thaumarchaeota archaeon]|nr:FkbM family methyltransferase [Nitrososphaerota archaeon]
MILPLQAFFFRDPFNDHIADILEEIYLKQVYFPFLVGKSNLTIVDFGANQGLTAYYLSHYGKVYAVEPSVRHLEAMGEMIKFNKIENIVVCPYAISNRNSKERFYHWPNYTSFSLTMPPPVVPQDDFEEVEVISFGEFIKRNKLTKIDLLKLDLEGEESKVIMSDDFIKFAPNISAIIGEWHEHTPLTQLQFQRHLESLGFSFKWLPNMKASVFTAFRYAN